MVKNNIYMNLKVWETSYVFEPLPPSVIFIPIFTVIQFQKTHQKKVKLGTTYS